MHKMVVHIWFVLEKGSHPGCLFLQEIMPFLLFVPFQPSCQFSSSSEAKAEETKEEARLNPIFLLMQDSTNHCWLAV